MKTKTEANMIDVTRYRQDGKMYICAGDTTTPAEVARSAAESRLIGNESLADDMERIDGCCTWTVDKNHG